jgi:hypothetical protein
MEITVIDVRKMSTDSWGEVVKFPLVTVMSRHDEYNNTEGARHKWMRPVGDVVVEVHTGITGIGLSSELNRDGLEHYAVE